MINHIALMGRFTATPELKQTNSGTAFVSFTLAVDRSYSKEKATDFINCVAWRNTAEFICRYFKKGQCIVVEGPLQSRKYDDRDGNKRTAYEVVVNQTHFCGPRESGTDIQADDRYRTAPPPVSSYYPPSPAPAPAYEQTGFADVPDDGDLPF